MNLSSIKLKNNLMAETQLFESDQILQKLFICQRNLSHLNRLDRAKNLREMRQIIRIAERNLPRIPVPLYHNVRRLKAVSCHHLRRPRLLLHLNRLNHLL